MTVAGFDADIGPSSFTARVRVGLATIHVERIHGTSEIVASPGAERWLVAVHSFYAEGKQAIRRDLDLIRQLFQPSLGLFTCHHANLDGIRHSSPFAEPGVAGPTPALRLSGELEAVNAWRHGLAGKLGSSDDPLLTRATEWDPERGRRDNRAIWFGRG